MSVAALELVLLDYAFMWSLALGFFRRSERPPLAWWLTGLHFAGAPVLLVLTWRGFLPAGWTTGSPLHISFECLSVLLAAASLVLLALTRGNQRVRLSQWHMQQDAPVSIVTWGPHAMVRHPFYVGYILGAAAVLFLAPGVPSLVCLVYTASALVLTARREERRLLVSPLGAEYAAYMARTGAFWPRWRFRDRS